MMQRAITLDLGRATVSDLFRPGGAAASAVYNVSLVLVASALLAASAWIEIRLPLTVVPITGQTFALLLIAALLGPTLGVATVLLYLAQGAAGLPVFAGGAAGAPWILGPTGGYLIGFIPAAWTTGHLARRGWDRTLGRTALAMTIGNLAVYAVGLPWLALFVGVHQSIVQGFLPFLPGAAIKIAIAAALLPGAWALLAATVVRHDRTSCDLRDVNPSSQEAAGDRTRRRWSRR